MELTIARRIAAELGIHVELVVREFWEMAVLQRLFESGIGERLVFKGGTALRLAYGSPRFSDDIDFALTRPVDFREFESVIVKIARALPELEVTDLAAKFYTLRAEFRVRDATIDRTFRQVIEVSRRKPTQEESELRLLSSPCTPLTVLARVATTDAIEREKLAAIRTRKAPRDLFDLWFLSQKAGRKLPGDLPRFDARVLRRDLRKYLPARFYPVVEELAK